MILDMIASNNTPLQITVNSQQAVSHFFAPQSHIYTILNEQINQERIYDFFFDGKKDLTVIDAGANVGLFSVFCSPSSKQIFAVEPTPSHFFILNEVTAPFSNIKPLNYAVWDKDEDIKFYIVDHNTTSNNAMAATNKSVNVIGRKLQTIVQENNIEHIDLIKMDIEGSEFKVVNDELLEFAYPIIDNWFLEVHPYAPYCNNFNHCRDLMINMFTRHGYKAAHKGNDGLFIHK